ncbi:MAG TPA: Rpn family recombination-promoting nuclease/putative transposase [Gemmataceae bacterium]|nr:Rpn family recombination-promoting nuclease/putative transposase [Gemmataceae bacterium]
MPSRPTDDWDSPWKEALDLFLRQFLAFFFPAIHDGIDWSKGYVSLDKEFQQIVRNARAGRRLADKLFKVWLKTGKEAWLLIHIEIQGQWEKNFARRMFTYCSRIFDRYQRRCVSVAVLCDDNPKWKPDYFGYNMWGFELGIRFPVVKIIDYRGREDTLEKDRNPFAALVLAQLKAIETKHLPAERQTWKIRLVKGLYDRGLEKREIQQLFRLIDWIMTLPDEWEQGFREEIDRFEEELKMPYVTSVERLAKQEGLQEGRQKGIYDGLAVALEAKFSTAGKKFMKEIRDLKNEEQLLELTRMVHKASTIDELRAMIRR